LEELAARQPGVRLVFGDAMDVDLAALDPAPTAMVANLPYSIATPLILRTIADVPGLRRWTVMVQREIADRLRAAPGTKAYGSPSVLAQLACRVELLRTVDPAVFRPRPRVQSALLRLERVAPWPGEDVARLVRASFAHRRKALARSVSMAGVASRERTLAALDAAGLSRSARAQELAPADFTRLHEELRR
jgi:16S rRNA (adenine1518-N6/adenine1519-N6)-dimethyltransferase